MTSTSETRLICMVSKSVFLISTSKSSFYLNLPFLASLKFYALTVTAKEKLFCWNKIKDFKDNLTQTQVSLSCNKIVPWYAVLLSASHSYCSPIYSTWLYCVLARRSTWFCQARALTQKIWTIRGKCCKFQILVSFATNCHGTFSSLHAHHMRTALRLRRGAHRTSS